MVSECTEPGAPKACRKLKCVSLIGMGVCVTCLLLGLGIRGEGHRCLFANSLRRERGKGAGVNEQ